MSEQPALTSSRHRWWPLVCYVLGVAIGVAVLVVLFTQRDNLRSAWHELARVRSQWVLAAVLAEGASIAMFSYVQRRVLKAGGATVGLASLFVISLANNAIANTVPGEPAVSSAFRYRQYRRRGVNEATSGWTILTIIIAQAIGMSSLLLVGVIVTLATTSNASTARVALVGLVVVLGAGALLVRRDLLLAFLGNLVLVVRRVTGHPRGDLGEKITTTLERMREIQLGSWEMANVMVLATLVWALDLGCLLCAFAAARAPVPWHGIVLAYGVAQIVTVLPVVPGGLGLVEGGLTVFLVAYGSTRVHALSSVLVYRAVSFWLAVAVGWLSFGVLSARGRRQGTSYEVPHRGEPALDDVDE
jgi:uncharacterized protein (TIRG00374 family)